MMAAKRVGFFRMRTCNWSLRIDAVSFLEQVQPLGIVRRGLIPWIVISIQDLTRLCL
jgi:hypothetical protein